MKNRPLVTAPPQTRGWLLYYATVSVAVVMLLVAAVVGIATDNAQNKAQDRLLGCFDEYAKTQNTGSTIIREKSVARDAAFDWYIRTTGRFYQGAKDGRPRAELLAQFDQVLRATMRLDRKSAVLRQARKDNPVPAPPSTFCDEES